MREYILVIGNEAGLVEYKKVKSNDDFAVTVKMENGLLNSAWKVNESQSFELTEAMKNHFNLVKNYRELEEIYNKMSDIYYDHAQFYFNSDVIEQMEKEINEKREILKEAKKKMQESSQKNNWTTVERRGMKQVFKEMKNITNGEL